MDPVPSAWKINAWTGLWWFYAAGDGWNSSCAASAHASSSFAFLVLFGGQVDAPGAEFREEAAFSQSPGNSFLGMPDTGWFLLLWHTWDTRNTKLFYFLLTFPSSGESQLGKCGPASIRSMIHERIPLPVGRLQQPSAKVRCQKGKPCAGLSQMEHPSWLVAHASCSLGSRRTESSCQRELQREWEPGAGSSCPAAPCSPQLLLCLCHRLFIQ